MAEVAGLEPANDGIKTRCLTTWQGLTRDTDVITIRSALQQGGRNDCQQVVTNLYPEVGNALNLLNNFGLAKMTGTGACVFTSFSDEKHARQALIQIPADYRAFVAKGSNLSSTHKVLYHLATPQHQDGLNNTL